LLEDSGTGALARFGLQDVLLGHGGKGRDDSGSGR
jgi:hypothetical protein